MLEDVLNKDFVVDQLLETALDPMQEVYEPDEYVTQEPTKTEIVQNPSSDVFKPLSELSAEKDQTFGALIQDAVDNRNSLLANSPSNLSPSDSLDAPASPLEALLGNNTKIANPQVPPQAALSGVDIVIDKNTMTANMKEIRIAVGEKLPFNIQQKGKSELAFFLRTTGVVAWNQTSKVLSAEKEGSTELYISSGDKMLILPIHVGNAQQAHFEVPAELMVLSSLEQSKNLHADLDEDSGRGARIKNANPKGVKKKAAIERGSVAQTESYTFAMEAIPFEIEHVQFRVIDEHSDDAKIIPIPEVELHIIGSELSKKTDVLGMVSGVDVPRNSSFLLSVKDPQQRYRPSVVEVSASQINSGSPITIRLMEQAKYNSYLQIASSEFHKESGSLCATIQSVDAKPLSGMTLSLDRQKARLHYFNRYGYLDPLATQTSENGRFCVFDVEAGPVSFTFLKDGVLKDAHIPFTIFADAHLEHTFTLGDEAEVSTVLAAAPTAFEFLRGGQIVEKEYRAIDYASLVSFGLNQDWEYVSESSSMHSQMSVHDGRAYYLANSPEFETTLYRVDSKEEEELTDTVTTLFPSGFLTTISMEQGIDIRPDAGTVIVDHGSFEGQYELSKTVEVTLWDQHSNKVGERVTLTTNSGMSTMFYNVEPGTYTVVVKSASGGEGLAMDTVLVYSNTLSYKHTGSPRYRMHSDDVLLTDGG